MKISCMGEETSAIVRDQGRWRDGEGTMDVTYRADCIELRQLEGIFDG